MTSDIDRIIRAHSAPLQPRPTGLEPKLRPLEGIRAVLFDVYGTLLISASGDIGPNDPTPRAAAFREALRAAGLRFDGSGDRGVRALQAAIRRSHEESRRQGVEFPEVDIVAIWKEVLAGLAAEGRLGFDGDPGERGDPTDGDPTDEGLLRRVAVEYEVRTNPVWPMPGAAAALGRLRRAGLRLGLVTNAQFFTLALFPALFGASLEELGFEPGLRFISSRHGHAKPGIFLYERARDALAASEIGPAETIYVGNDVLKDVRPAAAVGFRTALFAGDQRSLRLHRGDPRVAGLQAEVVLTDLGQLPGCLPGV